MVLVNLGTIVIGVDPPVGRGLLSHGGGQLLQEMALRTHSCFSFHFDHLVFS